MTDQVKVDYLHDLFLRVQDLNKQQQIRQDSNQLASSYIHTQIKDLMVQKQVLLDSLQLKRQMLQEVTSNNTHFRTSLLCKTSPNTHSSKKYMQYSQLHAKKASQDELKNMQKVNKQTIMITEVMMNRNREKEKQVMKEKQKIEQKREMVNKLREDEQRLEKGIQKVDGERKRVQEKCAQMQEQHIQIVMQIHRLKQQKQLPQEVASKQSKLNSLLEKIQIVSKLLQKEEKKLDQNLNRQDELLFSNQQLQVQLDLQKNDYEKSKENIKALILQNNQHLNNIQLLQQSANTLHQHSLLLQEMLNNLKLKMPDETSILCHPTSSDKHHYGKIKKNKSILKEIGNDDLGRNFCENIGWKMENLMIPRVFGKLDKEQRMGSTSSSNYVGAQSKENWRILY